MIWTASVRGAVESDPKRMRITMRGSNASLGPVEPLGLDNNPFSEDVMVQDQIMTVEEVAELLRVSPRTVYEWASKKTIPCGKLGNAWRFKRSEVLKWVDANLQPFQKAVPKHEISFADVLVPERIVIAPKATKPEALEMLIDLLVTSPDVSDRRSLAERIYHREALMSTGIGLGCAVPHVRLDSVSSPVMAVGVFPGGVEGYTSLDSQLVRIVFMVAAGTGQHELHVKLLAQVGELMKDPGVIEDLLQASESSTVYDHLTSVRAE